MTETPSSSRPRPGEEPDRNPKKAGLIVLAIALVAVGIVAFVNKDRLLVHSDVTAPLSEPPAAPSTPNRPPEIMTVTASTDRIEPFSICDLECQATDPDGDVLTYVWSASSGDIYGNGASVKWGSPVSEGLYRVSVVVEDVSGGRAEHSVSLRVKENAAPEILSLSADADWVAAGSSSRFSCAVVDGDGDDVSVEWEVTAGELFGEGDAVIWLAPEEGDVHWITVVARDAYGGESRRAMPVTVTSGEPPKIVGLFLHGMNTDMLQKRGNDWIIYKGRTCTIKCAMEETSGPLTYEWSADFGTLVADGDTATWEAPSSRVGATILVVVTNEYGYKSSASVLIYVETCTCSF